MEAIILAGGLGIRLKSAIGDLPKPMAPVNGRPFIAYLLDYLSREGVTRATLALSYRYDLIMDFLGYEYQGIKLEYSIETEPQGTGGAIRDALKKTKSDRLFILNGDTMFRIALSQMEYAFEECNADMVIGLKEMENASRYGTVQTDNNQRVTGFNEKDGGQQSGAINGGVYLAKRDFLKKTGEKGPFSFERDVLEKQYDQYHIVGLHTDAFFLDIGIPKDYKQSHAAFKKFHD